ncbi:MAG: hypothetical protein AB1489_29920 [Acidobacteriota bacterium]
MPTRFHISEIVGGIIGFNVAAISWIVILLFHFYNSRFNNITEHLISSILGGGFLGGIFFFIGTLIGKLTFKILYRFDYPTSKFSHCRATIFTLINSLVTSSVIGYASILFLGKGFIYQDANGLRIGLLIGAIIGGIISPIANKRISRALENT